MERSVFQPPVDQVAAGVKHELVVVPCHLTSWWESSSWSSSDSSVKTSLTADSRESRDFSDILNDGLREQQERESEEKE